MYLFVSLTRHSPDTKAAITNELVLQQQGLFELPPAINELTELEILKLSANHLNSAPPHFEETLQNWLEYVVVPTYRTLIKDRKRGIAKDKI